MKRSSEKTTAIHEAGHAVVALLLGVLIEATIIPTDKYAGLVRDYALSKNPQKPTVREARKELLLTMAGPAAQDLYAGKDQRSAFLPITLFGKAEAGSDSHSVRQMAEIECGSRFTELPEWILEQKPEKFDLGDGDDLHLYIEWLFARTKRFLSHSKIRKAIYRVADALVAKKTLSAEEVREICLPIFSCKPIKNRIERTVHAFQEFKCSGCDNEVFVDIKGLKKVVACDECGGRMRNVTPQNRRISVADAKRFAPQETQDAVA